MARNVCRESGASCGDEKLARHVAGAPSVMATERLARADRRHAATVDQWDADEWLLNTPGGTVDLQAGALRPSAREDYCTKITAFVPGGDCFLWKAFLDRITNGDVELQQYLQRVCGYILTGSIRDHAFFFRYGTGGNGKSVFMETIAGMLGNYTTTAPTSIFIASQFEQHPTEMAGLHGARLAIASEIDSGQNWAESKLKRITGGDRIAARFMRQDFFEFQPQFKLVIAGNSKPTFIVVDEAMRRRIHLVPFTVTIPKAERDKNLAERLRSEGGGILQWAIEGCLSWQREGLNPPASVQEATHEYLAEEDVLGRWFSERIEVGPEHSSSVAVLFGNWREFCIENGEKEGSLKAFSQRLIARGFSRERTSSQRRFCGLTLKAEFRTPEFDNL
jgi:P4 family phage/plasmid primase-like protien